MKFNPRAFSDGLGVAGKLAVRMARKAIGWEKLIVYRMPDGVPAVTQKHEVIELGPADTAKSAPWQRREIEARFSSGARLFALRSEMRLVSFAWLSRRRSFHAGEIRRELHLDSPMSWIWDCVTPVEYRGCGYYPELIGQLAAMLGQRDVIIFVRSENTPSVRGIAKAGFRPWAEIAVTRWSARIYERDSFDGRLTILS